VGSLAAMSIWTRPPDLHEINRTHVVGLARHLGIQITDFDTESLTATMPITAALAQGDGLLNGGASAALAEITAGIAGEHCIDATRQCVVGQEINVSHLRSAKAGAVTATARPLRLGARSQVWQVELRDDTGQLIAVSRLTSAILERRGSTV